LITGKKTLNKGKGIIREMDVTDEDWREIHLGNVSETNCNPSFVNGNYRLFEAIE